jgi:hypothetical protein
LFKVAPEIAPFDFGDTTLNAGDAAQAQCMALKGDTPLNFTWTFHGDATTFQTGVVTASVGQRSSVLMIDSVTPNHAGTYTCTVRNQAANASYSTVLSVSGWFIKCLLHLPPQILLIPIILRTLLRYVNC